MRRTAFSDFGFGNVTAKDLSFSYFGKDAKEVLLNFYFDLNAMPFLKVKMVSNERNGIFSVERLSKAFIVSKFETVSSDGLIGSHIIYYNYTVDGNIVGDPYGILSANYPFFAAERLIKVGDEDKTYFLKNFTVPIYEALRFVVKEIEERKNDEGITLFSPKMSSVDFLDNIIKKTPLYVKNDCDNLKIYQLHVRGFSMRDESLPLEKRGKFSGVSSKIAHIQKIGANAVMLLPCYNFCENLPGNRVNFWGYGALADFFSPKCSYAEVIPNASIEFYQMVCELHDKKLDVYMEFTFPDDTPYSFIRDCLVFWHEYYGVDGFRIMSGNQWLDLLMREPRLYNARFFSDKRDVNPCYREQYGLIDENFMWDIRRFLRGDECSLQGFFNHFKKKSEKMFFVNALTLMTGFTLYDLFNYDVKHNEDNGEYNRDGIERNYSMNCGFEGPTEDEEVLEKRILMIRNAQTLLCLSSGAVMFRSGDEILHTQKGNNNAYCHDDNISYIDWNRLKLFPMVVDYLSKLNVLKRNYGMLNTSKPFRESDYCYQGTPDISFHSLQPYLVDTSFYARGGMIMYSGYYDGINGKADNVLIVANMFDEEKEFDLPLPSGNKKGWNLIHSTEKISTVIKIPNYHKNYKMPAKTIALFSCGNKEEEISDVADNSENKEE
ncbi:MAG: hypothetical protein MJ113_03775 [Lachnospiraceae bacterium]|nr:hypothetical protein [Lachnospiraceae bacterium]